VSVALSDWNDMYKDVELYMMWMSYVLLYKDDDLVLDVYRMRIEWMRKVRLNVVEVRKKVEGAFFFKQEVGA